MLDISILLIEQDFVFSLITRATLLITSVLIISYGFLKMKAQWRVLLLRATLLTLIFLPLVYVWVPSITFSVSGTEQTDVANHTNIALSNNLNNLSNQQVFMNNNINPPKNENILLNSNEPLINFSFNQWLFTIWIVGMLVMFMNIIKQHIMIKRILSNTKSLTKEVKTLQQKIQKTLKISKFVDLRSSQNIKTPFVYGIINPVIVIPEQLTREVYHEDISAVLAHELNHIKFHDIRWIFAYQVFVCLLWFHPLIWVLRSLHNRSCEEVCDLHVIQKFSNINQYSQILARITLDMLVHDDKYIEVAMAKLPEIRYRLNAIQKSPPFSPLSKISSIIMCCLLTILLTLSSSIKYSVAQNNEANLSSMSISEVIDRMEKARTEVPPLYFEKLDHRKLKKISPENKNPQWVYEVKMSKNWNSEDIQYNFLMFLPSEWYMDTYGEIIVNTALQSYEPESIFHDMYKGNHRIWVQNHTQGGSMQISDREDNQRSFKWNYNFDLVPLATILRENIDALNLSIVEYEGINCYQLQGDTTWGDYKVVIDPTHGYHPRIVECQRDTKDKSWDGRIMGETKDFPLGLPADLGRLEMYWKMEIQSFQEFDGQYILKEVHTVYKDKNVRNEIVEWHDIVYYENMKVNPDFEKMKAFELDFIPDNIEYDIEKDTRLYWDENNQLKSKY